jgi:hypothetical protein
MVSLMVGYLIVGITLGFEQLLGRTGVIRVTAHS